jgi:hypothetical protein
VFFIEMRDLKFLQRAIRACLQWAYPLTSLLLVSELNQSFYVGLACAVGAGETSSLPQGGRADSARAQTV